MGTFIVVVIILMVAAFAFRSSLSHFRGEGGCCGGSNKLKKNRKKRLKKVLNEKYIVQVDGMHCKSCAIRIENAINSVDGVVADVNLSKQTAKIKADHKIEISDIIEIIELEGYQVNQTQIV